jgi:hypothetical protein
VVKGLLERDFALRQLLNRSKAGSSSRLTLEISVNPLFDSEAAIVLIIEADAEAFASGITPAYRAANPYPRQGQQRERDLSRLTC